jgi:hypothetical protein
LWRPHFTPLLPVHLPTSWKVGRGAKTSLPLWVISGHWGAYEMMSALPPESRHCSAWDRCPLSGSNGHAGVSLRFNEVTGG